MKRWMKSLMGLSLAMVLAVGSIAPVWAEEAGSQNPPATVTEESPADDTVVNTPSDGTDQPDVLNEQPEVEEKRDTEPLVITQEEAEAMSDAYFDALPAADSLSEVEEQKLIQTAMEAIDNGIDPASWAKWGVKKLILATLGADDDPNAQSIDDKLDTILKNQNELAIKIGQIDEKVVKGDVIKNLNDFMKLDWNGEVKTYYGALGQIDSDLAAGKLTEDQAATKRQAILVYTMNNTSPTGAPSGALSDFDKNAYLYGSYLLESMNVLYGNGTDDLFGMYHQLLKYRYHWEHHAYEEWAGFQNYALGKYVSVNALNRLSLMARIQAIDEWNTAHPDQKVYSTVLEERFKQVGQQVEEMKQLTEDSQVVKRADDVRYYQYPGHEMLLYTKVNVQPNPEEPNRKVSMLDMKWAIEEHRAKPLKGIDGKLTDWGLIDYFPIASFWKPFTHYNGQTQLVDAKWLQQVRNDYGGNKDLYSIFFSADEGNLTAPNGANSGWTFAVNPTTENPLRFREGGFWKADRIYAPVMRSNGELYEETLYYYHNYSSEPNSNRTKSMGIGVVPGIGAGDDKIPVAGDTVSLEELNHKTETSGSQSSATSAPSTGLTDESVPYTLPVLLGGAALMVLLWLAGIHHSRRHDTK